MFDEAEYGAWRKRMLEELEVAKTLVEQARDRASQERASLQLALKTADEENSKLRAELERLQSAARSRLVTVTRGDDGCSLAVDGPIQLHVGAMAVCIGLIENEVFAPEIRAGALALFEVLAPDEDVVNALLSRLPGAAQ